MVFHKFAGGIAPEHIGTTPVTTALHEPASVEPIYGLYIPGSRQLSENEKTADQYLAIGNFAGDEPRSDQMLRAFANLDGSAESTSGSVIHRFRKDQLALIGKYAAGNRPDPEWTDGLWVQPLDPKAAKVIIPHLLPSPLKRATRSVKVGQRKSKS